ncbi:lysine transporter LysE [Streptomyces venezuelae]|uniref:Lysine transporter LysE n=1 Tax=Streptomyces venezuelae TaxID=54571 RepID=A0A5P2CGT1_STRVZ|nr:LysE family transporter [Streptomyces venezuelae]QES41437.1 lysine transporter LysE [Streptomyces venezuelae]
MSAILIAGLLAGYGIAMPVGGVGTYLVALTARTTWRTGACAALGVATADGLYALVAAAGGASLTDALEPAMTPLRRASVLVLVAMAARGTLTALREYKARDTATVNTRTRTPLSPTRAYAALLGLTLLNPATVLYFAALVLGSPATDSLTHAEQAAFALAAFAASASWQLLLAGGGALLGRVLTSRKGRLATALTSSALITGLAAHLLLSP